MATENINIVIREDGSRQVTQSITQLAATGDKAAGSMDTLARALEVLAGALAIDKLKDYADEWASVTGIVEVATKSHAEAAAVLNELFDAAQRIRSPIDELAGLYSRVARASADLGSSQQQAIQFTEQVGQALVVQHTTATQAAGALLQLGQLLGTGKIRAQEFNSVNENLAVVLQVVARNITAAGGSINTLKTLVEAGKVTSKDFFEAFLKGSAGLQADFDKSAFTIGQGFTLIGNAIVHMVGDLNNATGASNVFGKAAQTAAAHMKDIEDALVTITKLLATAAAAWTVYTAAQAASAAVARVSAFLSEIDAVAKGTLVILGSAEALRQKAVATQAAALVDSQAAIAARAAAIASVEGEVAKAEATTAAIVAQQTLLGFVRESTVAEITRTTAQVASIERTIEAATAAGAQSFALATLRTATVELTAAEVERDAVLTSFETTQATEVALEEALTAALGQQAVAQAAVTDATVAGNAAVAAANSTLVVSTGAVVATTAAAAGSTGRLAQVFALLRGAIAPVIALVGEFFVALNAHPIIALITALTIATALLLGFGDDIKLGTDKITTFGNVMSVFKDKTKSAFDVVKTAAGGIWDKFTENGSNALGSVTSAIGTATTSWASSFNGFFQTPYKGFANIAILFARTIDAISGLMLGLVFLSERIWTSIGSIIGNALKVGLNTALESVQDFVNGTIDILNKLPAQLGTKLIPHIELPKKDVEAFGVEAENAGKYIAESINDGFAAQGGAIEKTFVGIFDKASAKAAADSLSALRALEHQDIPDLTTTTKPKKPPIDPKEIDAATNALRELENKIAPAQGAVLQLAKDWQVLERAVKDGIITQDRANVLYGEATKFYRDILDPMGAYLRQLDQQNALQLVDINDRQATAEAMKVYQDNQKKNIAFTLADAAALKNRIQAGIDFARQIADEDDLINQSVNARRNYSEQLQAIQNLLSKSGSGFTKGDAAQALLKIDPEVLSTTKTSIDAVKAQYDELFSHIEQLRAKGAIDDTQKAQLQIENATRIQQKILAATEAAAQQRLALGTGTWADAQLVALSKLTEGFTTFAAGASTAFGNFFQSFTDGFADSVGKAVVESQNLNDALHNVAQQALEGLISALVKLGIQYVVNAALMQGTSVATTATTTAASVAAAGTTAAAWATAAELVNAATFGAGAVAGSAAVALAVAEGQGLAALSALPGLMEGGYTGDGGRSEIAGVVHGKEFVMNADATSRNRSLLEQLNAGQDASAAIRAAAASSSSRSGGGTTVQVTIEDHGTPKVYETKVDAENRIRVIARDEAQKAVPSVMKAQFADPNSTGSKALRQSTDARPRRS